MKAHSGLTPTRRRLSAAASAVVAGALLVAPGVTQSANAGARYAPAGPSCGTTIYKASGTPWTCTFDDEFSGTSVDRKKWTVSTSALYGTPTGQDCFMANNVQVSSGMLRISGNDAGAPFACNTPYGSVNVRYTGGYLGTVNTFSQAYGRFEVRAKTTKSGSGFHPAFYLVPESSPYGSWPDSGEIDVSEIWTARPNNSVAAVHYNGETVADSTWTGCSVADATQWHTYGLVWESTKMTIYVDGVACFVDRWAPNAPLIAPQPFDVPFNIILTNGVENSADNPVDSTTTFPSQYQIDYVKAWK